MNKEQKAARDAAIEQYKSINSPGLDERIGLVAGYDLGYAARDAEDAWVAVSRNPEESGRYLVLTDEGGVYCDDWRHSSLQWMTAPAPVVAWMLIPKYQPTEGE